MKKAEKSSNYVFTKKKLLISVPELYAVPQELVDAELASPGSQEFHPYGRIPFMWAQSLYIIGQLLRENYIACGELDPINRRLSSFQRPEVIVQVVVLAKDEKIKDMLAQIGFNTKTMQEVSNIEIHPARVLSHLYTFLGKCGKDKNLITMWKNEIFILT